MLRALEVFLLHGDISQPPPRIIVILISHQRLAIVLVGLFEIFIGYVFVAAESESIGEVLVYLDGAVEELNSRLMLTLQTITIPRHTPRLRRKQ